MIDELWLPTWVHLALGSAVLLATLASLAVALVHRLRRRELPKWALGLFIVTQVIVAAQLLLGIKLLDQGLGPMQLYVHYLGGTGVLFFYLLFYWLPAPVRRTGWTATVLTGLAFAFALMTYTIGEMYVPG
ncbi:MAG TPA: hypothetical protein VKZ43_06765 [Trueperaceae bacterium]|nr:hypothetical protein [Trueperaceae bacterium]